MQLEFLEIDLLRCDDLGVLQLLTGNALFECFEECGGQVARPDGTLHELLVLLTRFSRELKQDAPPLNALTWTMIKQRGKGPRTRCKASESRRLLPCVLRLLESLPTDTLYKQLRLQRVRWAPGLKVKHPGGKVDLRAGSGPRASGCGRTGGGEGRLAGGQRAEGLGLRADVEPGGMPGRGIGATGRATGSQGKQGRLRVGSLARKF